ncbi:major facilitator superfamily domain-containing protein [Lipomyces tetrasporus]
MLDIIRRSFGGEIIHLLSGGRLLIADDVVPVSNDPEAALKLADEKLDFESDYSSSSSAASTLSHSYVVDWYGQDDPENPRNWSDMKKLLILAEICFLTFSVYIGPAMYTPGIEQIMEEFHVGSVVALLPLAVYVAAYGIRPMIFAPLSETPLIGRNWVYVPSLLLFVGLQIPTALVKNIGGFIAVRAITGFVSSPPLANGGASIGDAVSMNNLSYGLALWSVSAVLAFAQVLGWRWTFWSLSWISGLAFIVLLFLLPETSEATILQRRARRLRLLTGDNRYTTKAEQGYANFTLREVADESFVRPFVITFTEPGVFFLNTYTTLIYAVMYSWFEAFPIVFVGIHHFNLIQTGLSYFGIMIGATVAATAFCSAMYFYLAPRLQRGAPPETIFRIALFAAPILPVSLLMFGWSSTASVHWIVPIIASGLFLLGGYTAMFVNLGRERFPVAWGSTLLAGIALLMVLIAVVLLILGHRLRSARRLRIR